MTRVVIGERMLVNLRKVTTIDEMGGWGEVGNMKCEVVSVLATDGAPVETICHSVVGGQHGGKAGAVQGGGGHPARWRTWGWFRRTGWPS